MPSTPSSPFLITRFKFSAADDVANTDWDANIKFITILTEFKFRATDDDGNADWETAVQDTKATHFSDNLAAANRLLGK